MRDSFDSSFAHVLSWEGGYTDDPQDPGGATNKGITRRTLAEWKGRAVTKEEVRELTVEEAKRIYRGLYWDKINGDELPCGIDLAVFDAAVNQGPKRAAKFLQKALGVKADGVIGPVTVAAAHRWATGHSWRLKELLRQLHVQRAVSYASLLTFKAFGRGWMARLFDTHDKAVAMMGGQA